MDGSNTKFIKGGDMPNPGMRPYWSGKSWGCFKYWPWFREMPNLQIKARFGSSCPDQDLNGNLSREIGLKKVTIRQKKYSRGQYMVKVMLDRIRSQFLFLSKLYAYC